MGLMGSCAPDPHHIGPESGGSHSILYNLWSVPAPFGNFLEGCETLSLPQNTKNPSAVQMNRVALPAPLFSPSAYLDFLHPFSTLLHLPLALSGPAAKEKEACVTKRAS